MADRKELPLLFVALKKRRIQVLELGISLLESLNIVSFAALLSVDDSSLGQNSRAVKEQNKCRNLELR